MCRISLNRPVYTGACMLDLIRLLIKYFDYNYIKNKYVGNSEMLLFDAGSLMNNIENENILQDFYQRKVI